MPETVILCGEAPRPKRAMKALPLAVRGPTANVRLESADVGRRMLASLPALLADLLDLATYVYAADQMVSRGGDTAARLGADWRRELRFIVPVREPEQWASPEVTKILERLLGFMSEDSFRFEFVQAHAPPKASDYLDFGGGAEEVLLFSGGLDSLAGAVDRLLNGHARLLLVSHVSSTKIGSRQKELARELGRRFPKRIGHVPIRIRMHGIEPVERTQRTRSFLFGALAATIARISGAGGFSLFENGVVSFNLPIASQVIGAAASRTTHPRVIRDLSAFLSALLEGEVKVENPYIWKTKSEVAESLQNTGHADLARRTISCSSIYWSTRLQTHCGRCSQCLDRRFGALAGGLGENDPEVMYEVDLLTGARADGADRTMAESFVRHALELHRMTEREFMGRFAGELARAVTCFPGIPTSKAAGTILDLHHRHAAAVQSVLEEGYRRHAGDLAAQTLPSTCILRLVAGADGIVARLRAEGLPPPQASEMDARDYQRTSELRLALDHHRQKVLIDGIPPLEGPGMFAILNELVAAAQKDRHAGRAPEGHSFLAAGTLAERVKVSEESLRRCIHRIRRRLAEEFETNAGLPLGANALIENVRWKGYRLNPAVLILAPDQLSPKVKGHDFRRRTSQLGSAVPAKTTS